MTKHPVTTIFLAHTLRAASVVGVLTLITACAMAPPPASLSMVELCAPSGRSCELAFVQIRQAANAVARADTTALVDAYFKPKNFGVIPKISVQAICSTGWAAAVESEQGSVHGACGYPSAESALNKALDICDAKTAGSCRQSNRIKADWGHWKNWPVSPKQQETGRPYKASSFEMGQMCDLTLPIVVSGVCSVEAAAMLRAAGVTLP